ncbi:MAG TPA: hypothetical protein VLA54_00130, partial [Acidimicrobiia bacterium]|nr:hypothetical protein [Acidimicrobiia bacterium]
TVNPLVESSSLSPGATPNSDRHFSGFSTLLGPCGRATVLADGRLSIALLDTAGGRWAAGLLADDLVDVVLWQGTVGLR